MQFNKTLPYNRNKCIAMLHILRKVRIVKKKKTRSKIALKFHLNKCTKIKQHKKLKMPTLI